MPTDSDNTRREFNQQDQNIDNQTNVGGDYLDNRTYNYFQASSPHLRRSFDALITDKLQNFVGRQFVFNALDKFLQDNLSGYFIIRAAPGMGKTALMAKLVNDRGYIHHFNIASQNIRSPRVFLENVCAQIIARYGLSYETLPLNAGEDSGFFSQCISQAAANSKNHPIVIIVDSLDESDRLGLAPAVNSLYLPSSLPQGVYVVITTRPLQDLHLQVMRQKIIDIEPESNDNFIDIHAYIANYVNRADMRTHLENWKVTTDSFIENVSKKSQGNFMYLYHVLPAIAEGRFRKGTLDELPDGLLAYYQRHWREMRDGKEKEFDTVYAPIVYILGVAQEPVTTDQIAQWTQLNPGKVKESIGDWREFLREEKIDNQLRFRIYHTSFQDFLKEQVDLKQYHRQIASRYALPRG
jgi:hypothetical protein